MRRSWLVVLALCTATGFGIGDAERGNRLYRDGRHAEAVEAYRQALEDGDDSPELRYNLGTALVRLARYDEAERHFKAALTRAVDPSLRERILYNLGNRYLEAARALEQPDRSVELYDAAVDAYKQALRLRPDDADAKWNYELALREREEQRSQTGGGGGGGGGGDQEGEDEQTGGGGGGQQPQPAPTQPGGEGQQPQPMSQEQAERILSAVEQDERELFRETLGKNRRETPNVLDW